MVPRRSASAQGRTASHHWNLPWRIREEAGGAALAPPGFFLIACLFFSFTRGKLVLDTWANDTTEIQKLLYDSTSLTCDMISGYIE